MSTYKFSDIIKSLFCTTTLFTGASVILFSTTAIIGSKIEKEEIDKSTVKNYALFGASYGLIAGTFFYLGRSNGKYSWMIKN